MAWKYNTSCIGSVFYLKECASKITKGKTIAHVTALIQACPCNTLTSQVCILASKLEDTCHVDGSSKLYRPKLHNAFIIPYQATLGCNIAVV